MHVTMVLAVNPMGQKPFYFMNNNISSMHYLLQLLSPTEISVAAFSFFFGEKLYSQLMKIISRLQTVP
jgi:hypothetical protein